MAFTFKSVAEKRRGSQYKSNVDIVIMQREHFQGRNPFQDQVSSIKEAQAFQNFLLAIPSLLEQRGLCFVEIPSASLQKDQSLHFWLSDVSLRCELDTAMGTDALEVFKRSENPLANEGIWLKNLFEDSKIAEKWLKSAVEILKKCPKNEYQFRFEVIS
eukprot:TRINITY_DN12601_c0_g2_i1.p1 TRINITY_DN12601_c0_g2~~TRINITY_DN12601_c0_g2_i1.p1  ORF type:complete len:159 (-),score=12.27 TRINITY_DN12601_c0_g2_i1:358-834(-)